MHLISEVCVILETRRYFFLQHTDQRYLELDLLQFSSLSVFIIFIILAPRPLFYHIFLQYVRLATSASKESKLIQGSNISYVNQTTTKMTGAEQDVCGHNSFFLFIFNPLWPDKIFLVCMSWVIEVLLSCYLVLLSFVSKTG